MTIKIDPYNNWSNKPKDHEIKTEKVESPAAINKQSNAAEKSLTKEKNNSNFDEELKVRIVSAKSIKSSHVCRWVEAPKNRDYEKDYEFSVKCEICGASYMKFYKTHPCEEHDNNFPSQPKKLIWVDERTDKFNPNNIYRKCICGYRESIPKAMYEAEKLREQQQAASNLAKAATDIKKRR